VRVDANHVAALEHDLVADRGEPAAAAFGSLVEQLANPPDCGVQRRSRALRLELTPEQIGEPLAPVDTIVELEQVASQ
jgi:hypothetical protein